MKPSKKLAKRAAARVKQFERTNARQDKNNFSPNASGPTHKHHKPGSMNKKKLGVA